MRVVGYTRVSTEEQSRSGLGLAAQRVAIAARAQEKGWEIVGWHDDEGLSARSLKRAGLIDALAVLKRHEAEALVVAKLDRLTRAIKDFVHLIELAEKQHWGIVVLDFDLDTTTAVGRLHARMSMEFAQYERELIGERTKAALAVKRAEGAQLGKPSTIPPKVQARIMQRHRAGDSLSAIARRLNVEGVPTPSGTGGWSHSVVGGVVKRWSQAHPDRPSLNRGAA